MMLSGFVTRRRAEYCEISLPTLSNFSAMSVLEHDASVAKTVEMPAITEDMSKDILLQKLQKSIHFEKTVAASSAANYAGPCTMALPAWFVTRHGDKFRTSVLLRSGLSTEPWRLQLNISFLPPCSRPEVKFSGGWKTFASANGLVVGDSLIFCLRAMSEFDVYVCRKTRSPIQPSSIQAPKKRSNDCELSKEKVKRSVGSSRRNLVAERNAGRVISETEEGEAGTGSRVNETLRDWQGKIFFESILSLTATATRWRMTLPTTFVQQHGDKIGKHVVLQSVPDRKMWTVNVHIYFPNNVIAQVVFDDRGWKAFVISNGLVKGDRLTFTLVAMSKFEVLILRSGGNPTAGPSVQGPIIRSKGSAFSQTWQPPKSLGPQRIALTGKSTVKLERDLSSGLFAEKGAAEDSVAYSVSDSSQSPSDMDSHFFEQAPEPEN